MADPQMVPADLLDVILPEDIYRFNYSYDDDEESEVDDDKLDQSEEENYGIVSIVTSALTSPLRLIFYLVETFLENAMQRSSYEKY